MTCAVKPQSAPGRFMQMVFDFLAPTAPGNPTAEGSAVVHAPIRNSGHAQDRTPMVKEPGAPAVNARSLLHAKATHALALGGFQVAYRLVRVKRKTIGMLVSEEGLEVRAPRWVSINQIQDALKERERWIIKQVQGMAKKAALAKRAAVEIESGCVVQVLGQDVQWFFSEKANGLQSGPTTSVVASIEKTLPALQRENAKQLKSVSEHIQIQRSIQGEWQACPWHEWCAALQEGTVSHAQNEKAIAAHKPMAKFRVVLPLKSLLEKRVQDAMAGEAKGDTNNPPVVDKTIAKIWMKAVLLELAHEVLKQRVSHFETMIGVTHTALTLGQAKHRWGSAGSNGAIRLNWHLVHVPMDLLDYVVAHELCHLKQMNHGPKFWAEMERVMPDYAARRRALKEVSMAQWT